MEDAKKPVVELEQTLSDNDLLWYWQKLWFSKEQPLLDKLSMSAHTADVWRSLINQIDFAWQNKRISSACAGILFRDYLEKYTETVDDQNDGKLWKSSLEILSDNKLQELIKTLSSPSQRPSEYDLSQLANAFARRQILESGKEHFLKETVFYSASSRNFSESLTKPGMNATEECYHGASSAESHSLETHFIHQFKIDQESASSQNFVSQKNNYSKQVDINHCSEKALLPEKRKTVKQGWKQLPSGIESTHCISSKADSLGGCSSGIIGSLKQKESDHMHVEDLPESQEVSYSFRTARVQLDIDNHKKFNTRYKSKGYSSSEYGVSRKVLGSSRGPASKFVPPVTSKSTSEENEKCSLLQNLPGGNPSSVNITDERLKNIDPKMIEIMMNEIMDHGPPVTWDDIAGLEFAKKTIMEIVVWPMLRPDIFTGLRGPPKGILLFGPPGTGKTLIGKCIASQSKATFFSISASSLTSKWVGEGEKLVRALFAVSRCYQPSVIFIDEIDSLLTQRSNTEHESSRRIKTELLVQLDGITTSTDERLLIVGATNRPQELDEAARRRLVKRLYIPLPESAARCHIITRLLSYHNHSLSDDDLDLICQKTEGYSGADMTNLCKEASLGPIRSLDTSQIQCISPNQVRPINLEDFFHALKQVRASVSDKDMDTYLNWNEKYGSGAV
ncbi:fidgetin-like protein 1 isoform X2 [Limulus polyphemus]|uniref:Fidgetin-like protein 1 n=1 Tax=Limulus polyphemus TaxID=6850 RepID=A0ABM1BQV3_LIMPO|nr:fidgetin-like protein 1 isoform X2 [Limulus polyphemus]